MRENKILKWALILSAVIVANLFFNYALSLTFNGPNQEEFCPFEKTSKIIEDKETCEASNGIWSDQNRYLADENLKPVGHCDLFSKCNNAYETAREKYEQKVFVALIIIGAIVLIASAFLKSNVVLNSALAITAVLDFIIASIRYWQYSKELLKVSILFVALLVIFYIIVKKFKNSE